MNYLLIENNQLVCVCGYKPNISDDNIQIIEYAGSIPAERILYIDGQIADSNDYIILNGKYVKNTAAVAELVNTNREAKKYLNNTDWIVLRHRDQVDSGLETSLTQEQYIDLLNKRQAARERVVEYGC